MLKYLYLLQWRRCIFTFVRKFVGENCDLKRKNITVRVMNRAWQLLNKLPNIKSVTLLTATCTYTWVFVILSISFRFLTNYNYLCNDNSMIFLLQSLNNRLIFDSNEYLALDSNDIQNGTVTNLVITIVQWYYHYQG